MIHQVNDGDLEQFGHDLIKELFTNEKFMAIPEQPYAVQLQKNNQEIVYIDLLPFKAEPQPATANKYFASVESVADLLSAYEAAKNDHEFENSLDDAMVHVSDYADEFLQSILNRANHVITDKQAKLIGSWLANLDVYAAVKSVESLLNSKADVALLELAQEKSWMVHFDHMAIRCGTKAKGDAERIVALLKENHGYVSSQISNQAFYQFEDGWNAYPLYKILDNGQVIRIFVDQSDADNKSQIIQHWNYVYGYTAHHLAIRASYHNTTTNEREAVSLDEIMQQLRLRGIEIMTPTGAYTEGLLLQVFTKPEVNHNIPDNLKKEIEIHGQDLNKKIENGKLLEIVSRKELSKDMAKKYFALYGLKYDSSNPLHTAPVYQYFLPAQAAHVIKTSVQT